MGLLRSVHRVTLPDKVQGCEILKAVNIMTFLLLIERSQLQSFGHMTSRRPQERLVKQVVLATPKGKRPSG